MAAVITGAYEVPYSRRPGAECATERLPATAVLGDARRIVLVAGDHFGRSAFADLADNYNRATREHLAPWRRSTSADPTPSSHSSPSGTSRRRVWTSPTTHTYR
ncbi:hypothetical protein [Streptomyces sp. NPDC058457]|uniref:hypothetical protein n=1 Tax=Streptomyces sp. NPDC058457 TaxID=3346507 RepID=UPI0036680339